MLWQDIVIAVCQLAFVPAMLPTILGKDKPALSTSILNVIIVSTIAFCFATLGLWFSMCTALSTGVIWFILAVQKYQIDH